MRALHASALAAMAAVFTTALSPAADRSLRIEVQRWTAARSGWLYVLDASLPAPRVLLIDPARATIAGVIRVGGDPDLAISPQGDRLYVAAGVECPGGYCRQIAIIDTTTGQLLASILAPDMLSPKGYPSSSFMKPSADGRTLYVMSWQAPPSGDAPVGLAVFDTAGRRFLDNRIDLGDCRFASFAPAPKDDEIAIHCGTSNEFVVYRLFAPDQAAVAYSVRLPLGRHLFAGHVYDDVAARTFALSANRERLFVANGDGSISDVNLALGRAEATGIEGHVDETVLSLASPLSGVAARFPVAVGPDDGRGTATEIRVFDTPTWTRTATIRASLPIVAAVMLADGSTVYGLTGKQGKVLAFDVATATETRVMSAGVAPSFAVVAP